MTLNRKRALSVVHRSYIWHRYIFDRQKTMKWRETNAVITNN